MVQVNPELGVRRFNVPARIVREAISFGLIHQNDHVLEVGSGSLRNAIFLKKLGIRVDVSDLPTVVKRYSSEYAAFSANGGHVYTDIWQVERYDAIICTFVLGAITPKAERLSLLSRIAESLTSEGILLLSVRGPGDVKTKSRGGKPWRDGFITPNGTFIKPFRRPEVIDLASLGGLCVASETAYIRSNSGIVDLLLRRMTT